jgi:hypothetical protein
VSGACTVRQAAEREIQAIADLSGAHPDQITGCLPEFVVAAAGDRLVGAVRLARLGADEWWLSGPYVRADFHAAEVGRDLYHYAVRQAEAIGSGIVRLCADAGNRAWRELAAEAHFSQVGRYLLYRADTLANARKAAEFRLPEDAQSIGSFLESSPHFAHAQRSLEESRTWYLLNPGRLAAHIAELAVLGWYSSGSLDGVIILDMPQQNADVLSIAYLDAAVGSLAVMAQAVRSLGAALGCRKVQHRFLARPERLVAIEQAGWRPPAEGEEVYLYSRPLGIDRTIDP